MLRPYKFLIQPVLTEVDDSGEPINEYAADPMTIVGLPALKKFAETFDEQVAALETQRAQRPDAIAIEQATAQRAEALGEQEAPKQAKASKPKRKR
jgi:hypothetical protein